MNDWKINESLKASLNKYVSENFSRSELLDFMVRDFSCYPWSLRTLDRRLRHFNIFYARSTATIKEVRAAVIEELSGPGQLLGYRAMHKKIRQIYNFNIPRGLIYELMHELDSQGLKQRTPCFKKKRNKIPFTSCGPNWVHSLDGHDKLMGYQNSTFPIAIYGCLDSCSRKLLWANVWTDNSNPKLIARFYLEHLYKSRIISRYLRLDRGTETGHMAAIHAFIRQEHSDVRDSTETIIYGPSTSNQVIYHNLLVYIYVKVILIF